MHSFLVLLVKKKIHISLSLPRRSKRSFLLFFPPFRVCLHRVLLPLAQADLAPEHGDHQNDGEAAEHPEVLNQEEDHLGGGAGVLLGDAVHLWELRGWTKDQISVM